MHERLSHQYNLYSGYGELTLHPVTQNKFEDAIPITSTGGNVGPWTLITVANGSGMSQIITIKQRLKQRDLLNILMEWIEEYGDHTDPDFDDQIADLTQNPISLRQP